MLEVLCLAALSGGGMASPATSLSPTGDTFALSVSVFTRHKAGDVIGNDREQYRLEEHLDYLGLDKYHREADALDGFALLPFSSSSLLDASPAYNTLPSSAPSTMESSSTTKRVVQVNIAALNDSSDARGLINQGINIKNSKECTRGDFCLNKNIFLGGHGEIWRGNRISRSDYIELNTSYILKRMHIKNKLEIQRCAEREIYFGNLLKGNLLFTQLDSYFSSPEDVWLVFVDDGISLNNLLYASTIVRDTNPMLQPSQLWKKMRTTPTGMLSLKSILHCIMRGVSALHDANILHRDIKPSNILINSDATPRLVIADFSSAVSDAALKLSLYDGAGPSKFEETEAYAPPEVLLSLDSEDPVAYDSAHPLSYDVWSIGVVFLELILGTSDVFSVDQRTSAMIQHRMRGATEMKLKQALLLASWSEFCIFREDVTPLPSSVAVARSAKQSLRHDFRELDPVISSRFLSRECGLAQLSKAILRRDVLGLGYDDYWGLDLLRRLLQWNPADRISLRSAVKHAYFTHPYVSELDGSEHGTEEDLFDHDYELMKSRGDFAAADENDEDLDHVSSGANDSIVEQTLLVCSHENCDLNVLESEQDTSSVKRVIIDEDLSSSLTFTCPKCKRQFFDWKSCNAHLLARKHGVRCLYDSTRLLPCLSHHSLLPIDPQSGWCEYTGRRKYIEDYHSVLFADDYKYFGVFDGHLGNLAARYASKNLHTFFELHRQAFTAPLLATSDEDDDSSNAVILAASNGESRWHHVRSMLVPLKSDALLYDSVSVASVVQAIYKAFADTHFTFIRSKDGEPSGTTSTVAILFEKYLLIAHVGDSRAVLCCTSSGLAIQLTVDHTPNDLKERQRIESEGGYIDSRTSVPRVNGVLAVTRSLGDAAIPVVSAHPDLLLLNLTALNEDNISSSFCLCDTFPSTTSVTKHVCHFLIVASDGLWDVVSNDEAVAILCSFFNEVSESNSSEMPSDSFQKGAQLLAQEAYVRGSMDNIGVCVIDITVVA